MSGSGNRPEPAAAATTLWGVAAVLVGTFSVFHRQILAGFASLQTLPQDPLFQNWALEHGWRWLSGAPLARSLWSPPFFHPDPGGLAFADPQFGLLLFYAPARAFGAAPHAAYALAAIAALAVTFAAFRWLYRGVFELPAGGATLGAYLVAYGAPRAAALNHCHFFAHFPTAGALGALAVAADARRDPRHRVAGCGALPVLVALQVYANVYLGFLLGLLVALAALPIALDREARRALAGLGRRGVAAALGGALAAALLLAPLGAALGRAQRDVAAPPAPEIALYEPRPGSWLNTGETHLLEPWLATLPGIALDTPVPWAHSLGVGLFTTALVLAGAWLGRGERPGRWLGPATLLLALATLRIDGVGSLWTPIYGALEPLRALRVVSRVGLVALPFAGVALGRLWARLAPAVARPILGLTLALILLEQVRIQPAFEVEFRDRRAREIAAALPADCDSFYYSPIRSELVGRRAPDSRDGATHQVDAMWAAFAAQRPTLNGYSSHGPRDWPLSALLLIEPGDVAPLRARLADWIDRRGLGDETVCWLRAKIAKGRIESTEIERFLPRAAGNPR